MATLAELIVRIGADISGFEGEIKGINKQVRAVGQDMERLGRTLTLGVSLPLAAAGAAALKAASDFTQLEIGFETMLGSGEAASKFLRELEDFAKSTPFQFNELADASKRLLAMGFAAEDLIPTMRSVGDAVAAVGGGQEAINRITLALGQMQAKGKVSAEEMRQLTEAGIPAWELLADTLGTDVAGAMDLVTKRAVDSGPAIAGMIEGINERFGGQMDKLSKEVVGKVSNLMEQLDFIMRDFGKGLEPAAMDVLDALTPVAEKVRDLAQAFGDADPATQKWAASLGGLTVVAFPAIAILGQLANLAASSGKGIGILAGWIATAAKSFAPWIAAAAIQWKWMGLIEDAAKGLVKTLADLAGIDFDAAMARNNAELQEFLASMGLVESATEATARQVKEDAQAWSEFFAVSREGKPAVESLPPPIREVGKAAKESAEQLKAFTEAEKRMAEASAHLESAMQDLGESLNVINDNRIHELEGSIKDVNDRLRELGDVAPDVSEGAIDVSGAMESLDEAMGSIPETAKKTRESLSQVSTIITDFGRNVAEGLFDVLLGGTRNDFNRRLEDQSSALRDSLRSAESDLRSSLDERASAYEEFAQQTMESIAGIREEEAARLAGQLSDLRDNLSDRTREYGEYADDIAEKLERINEDYRDNLADQNRALKEALAERKLDYDRDVEDLRLSHERKVEDLRRAIADELAEGQDADQRRIRDLQERLNRENEDFRIAMDRRNEDFRNFQAQQARDAAEFEAEQRERLNRETADLNDSLDDRRADYQRYVDDVNQRAAELTAESRKREEEKVTALREALAKQEEEHKKFVDKATAEYERLKADTTAQLAEIHGKHKTVLDDIGGLFKSVFEEAGKAITRFVAETLVGLLIPKLKTVTDLFGKIFGGGGGSSHTVGFPELGGGGGGGGWLSGLGGSNPATAIASAVGSGLTAYFTGMNGRILELIEKEVRYGTDYLGDRGNDSILGQTYRIGANTEYILGQIEKVQVPALWAIQEAVQLMAANGIVVTGAGGGPVDISGGPINIDPAISDEVEKGVERTLTRARSRGGTPLPGGPGITLNPGDTTGLFGPSGLRRGRGRGGQLPTRAQLEAMGLTSAFMQFGTTGPEGASSRLDTVDPGLTGDLWDTRNDLVAFARENSGNSSTFLGGVHGKTLQAMEVSLASLVALTEGIPGFVQSISENVSMSTPDLTAIKDGTWRTNEILEVISSKLDTLNEISGKLDDTSDSLTKAIATA